MKKVLGFLLVVVVLFLGFVATRPNSVHVERSATIGAAPEAVFPLVDDFHEWAKWSPWDSRDPQMKKTYTGPESGVGAVYHWSGNDKVGEGQMTLTEALPPSRIGIDLAFIKPFEGHSKTAFTLAPDGAGTRVTWAMDTEEKFVGKVMGVFMNMDKMVGPDFEAGLANLKRVAESSAPPAAAADSTAAAPAAAK
jgi:hypothetical protein